MIVTVVTPALNGMRWLPECIDSTQQQAGPDIEVEHIVVDGGSSDGTPDYAASRAAPVLTRRSPVSPLPSTRAPPMRAGS